MLFLLPPSETKRVGGNSLTISEVSQSFGALSPARKNLCDRVVKASKPSEAARKLFKLSQKQSWELEHNRQLWSAPTMPALERYSGTLFDAIDYYSLSGEALNRAKQFVLIQSSLFGLVSASDRIPFYRFSATTKLPGVNLKAIWPKAHEAVFERLKNSGPIIDLRSKSYQQLAPIPSTIESYWVEVVSRNAAGETKALNHFNKKSKGLLIRAILETRVEVRTIAELSKVAAGLGFELVVEPDQLKLVIPDN